MIEIIYEMIREKDKDKDIYSEQKMSVIQESNC